jgi:hypothetical protein
MGPASTFAIKSALVDLSKKENAVVLGSTLRAMALTYDGNMRLHKFCGALPGDGWSGNFEAAIAHGNIKSNKKHE